MKIYSVANKSWWVPESSPWTMAVQIRTPTDFLPALREKILRLAMETPEEEREYLARINNVPEHNPEILTMLAMSGLPNLAHRIALANPEMEAEPADETTALEAIKDQAELTLADYLA